MAQQALTSGRPVRRRALFGLLDAEGWSWASVKATFWFIVMIMLLGYIPDRAYYFTVFPTIDLGILAWSPINLCPPENEHLPCPVPTGAALPWHESPNELRLPAARADGGAVQVGTDLLYVGGNDGSAATAEVFRAKTVGVGNFGPWEAGPPLPAPRADAAVAFVGGSVFVVGGFDETGAPTTTTFVLTPDPETGDLGEWRNSTDADLQLDLPEARAAAAIVPITDGVVLIGGDGPSGPTQTVYKSTLDAQGALGPWQDQPQGLYEARSHANAAQVGDFIWLFGGNGPDGKATASVQRGTVTAPVPATGTAAAQPSTVGPWGVAAGPVNLPEPRTDAAGFTANGALYLAGGTDDQGELRSELYWSVPTADGNIPEWKRLAESDLPPGGRAGTAPVVLGSSAIGIAGRGEAGLLDTSLRSNLAPQPPFFQLGILGMTIPGLKIEGEVGQQLGWINAATIGAINFIILLIIGWAFAHKAHTREIIDRLRRRRGR
jgi:N-acetylneuraminic acid mutarotase